MSKITGLVKKNYKQASRRLTWFLYRKKRILRAQLKDLLKDNVKLHLGCGDKKLKGYVNIDIVPLEGTDVVMDVGKDLHLIPSGIAIEIRLENFFEHLYRYEQDTALREFHRILKKDGKLVLTGIPDFDLITDAYIKKRKGITGERFDLFNVYRLTHGEPIPKNSPFQLHKDIFTKESVRALFERNGFKIEKMSNEIFPGEPFSVCIDLTAGKA